MNSSSSAAPSRGRAVSALAGLGALAGALVVGLVLWLIGLLGPHTTHHAADTHRPQPAPTVTAGSPDTAAQNALAARPMPHVPDAAANPQPLAGRDTNPPMTVPTPTQRRDRSHLVATGFPHIPAGAVAQLAAIDEAALDGADPTHARAVYRWAGQPGAVALRDWNMYQGVSSLYALHSSLGQASYTSTFQVAEGIDKGSVGPDFTVACVLGIWSVTANDSTTQLAGADCQRMVWTPAGWRIGPGAQPAESPGTWPGSADAVRVGWRALKHG